ncbi:MAG: hypothetical protein HY260_20075 [Chloroflexi bacterium]|nr:hypothetical protein [Chloroflexota bacterium]
MNHNYRKGARLEQKARKLLESLGYTVIRSAGSKGPADLIAIGPTHVRLIQVKATGALRPSDITRLREVRGPVLREIWEYYRGTWRTRTVPQTEETSTE